MTQAVTDPCSQSGSPCSRELEAAQLFIRALQREIAELKAQLEECRQIPNAVSADL